MRVQQIIDIENETMARYLEKSTRARIVGAKNWGKKVDGGEMRRRCRSKIVTRRLSQSLRGPWHFNIQHSPGTTDHPTRQTSPASPTTEHYYSLCHPDTDVSGTSTADDLYLSLCWRGVRPNVMLCILLPSCILLPAYENSVVKDF